MGQTDNSSNAYSIKNPFYALFYSFVNPKTWTFYGPWGMCATRQEYWSFVLGIVLLCLSAITVVGPIIFLIFAFVNSMHRSMPSTSASRKVTWLYWILLVVGILSLVFYTLYIANQADSSSYYAYRSQRYLISPAFTTGLIFVNLLWKIIGAFTLIGFLFLVCRRAHDIGTRGVWWVVGIVGIPYVVAPLLATLDLVSYINLYSSFKSERMVAFLTIGGSHILVAWNVIGVIVSVLLIVILGIIPSKTQEQGNFFKAPLPSKDQDEAETTLPSMWDSWVLFWNSLSAFQPGKNAELYPQPQPQYQQPQWPQSQGGQPPQWPQYPQGQQPWQQPPQGMPQSQPWGQQPLQQAVQQPPQGQPAWQGQPPQGMPQPQQWGQQPPQSQAPWQAPAEAPATAPVATPSAAEVTKPVVEPEVKS